MIMCLKAYGFGDSLIKWVIALYSNILSSVIVKRFVSDPFPVTRGVTRTKVLYSTLLKGVKLEPRVCRIFPSVDFQSIFKEIYKDFTEHYVSDVSWKIVHEILPINYVLYSRNGTRDKSCTFCGGIETFNIYFFIAKMYVL